MKFIRKLNRIQAQHEIVNVRFNRELADDNVGSGFSSDKERIFLRISIGEE